MKTPENIGSKVAQVKKSDDTFKTPLSQKNSIINIENVPPPFHKPFSTKKIK